MPIEKFKDVEIETRSAGVQRFRVGLMTARRCNWVVDRLIDRLKGREESEETSNKIQGYVLETCRYLKDTGGALPVAMTLFAGDAFQVKELELDYDIEAVRALVSEGLNFNTGPFFKKLLEQMKAAEAAAKEAAAALEATAPQI